jgi:2-oxoglutarate dehydrogenase E2 component (dihydrolipoamide succinyltransferase)
VQEAAEGRKKRGKAAQEAAEGRKKRGAAAQEARRSRARSDERSEEPMKTEVVMPQMGESVAEGTVTKWLKGIGERVDRDEPLFELTTDKVDADVPSPVDGVLVEIRVQPGETVEVNAIVAIIDTEAAEGTMVVPNRVAPAADTATTEIARPAASTDEIARQPAVGSNGAAMPLLLAGTDATAAELRRTRSTPLVRKIAAQHGIEDISAISGSGLSGRVTKKDILAWIASGSVTQARAPRRDVHLPPVVKGLRDRVELMSPQRQMIAQHMVASRANSAHAQTIHEIDFSSVVKARSAQKAEFESRGIKLTYTAFLVKAVAEVLPEFPLLNAAVDGDNIVYRGDINIGVAVDTGKSLIVPVIRNVDEMSLLGAARAVNDLSVRARTKKLKPEDVKEGTFTISNPGIFGSEFGIPIINQPQVAILVTGAIKKRVVVDQETDAIMVRPTSIWCLSFDHRVVDGATADRFMRRLREVIEGWQAVVRRCANGIAPRCHTAGDPQPPGQRHAADAA